MSTTGQNASLKVNAAMYIRSRLVFLSTNVAAHVYSKRMFALVLGSRRPECARITSVPSVVFSSRPGYHRRPYQLSHRRVLG